MCEDGSFRSDLYYRLSVFPIEIPPLRERIEDVPLLVEVFLRRLNKFNSKEIHDVHPAVMAAFERYTWPGNIRELENLIERAYILETSSVLTPESFPSELFRPQTIPPGAPIDAPLTLEEVRRRGIEQIDTGYLYEFLGLYQGRRKESPDASSIALVSPKSAPDISHVGGESLASSSAANLPASTIDEVRQRGIAQIERAYLNEILMAHRGRITDSANAAGIGIRQLNKLMNKYGIKKGGFKSLPVANHEHTNHSTLNEVRQKEIEQIESVYLSEILASNKGQIKSSAVAAGIGIRQLNKLMSKYGIRKEQFRSRVSEARKSES